MTLTSALPLARPDERAWLATDLVELAVVPSPPPRSGWARRRARREAEARRAADAALAEVVRHWTHIPDDLKPMARQIGAGRWGPAARAVGPDVHAARGLAALALETADTAFIPPLADLLSAPGLQTGMYVERALIELIRQATGLAPELVAVAGSRAATTPSAQASLFDAPHILGPHLHRAVMAFPSHRARGVIWGAMMLLDRRSAGRAAPQLWSWLHDKEQPALPALRGVIRWSAKPLARWRAWEWLTIDHLATAAADRLTRAQTALEHELVLSRHHLAMHPRRAARLRAVGRSSSGVGSAAARAKILPPPAMFEELDAESRLGVARLAAVLKLGPEMTRGVLEPALVDPDPAVRHAASRGLTPRGLSDYTLDADPRVARSAMLALSTLGVPETRRRFKAGAEPAGLYPRLGASPHRAVRVLAAQEVARLDWAEPGSPIGRVEARRRLEADRPTFLHDLRERWEAGTPADRSRLVLLIRRLGLQNDFREELARTLRDGLALLRPAMDPDPLASAAPSDEAGWDHLAAVTVTAVAEARHPALEILQEALHAPDARVRANTVEAIDRLRRAEAHGPDVSLVEMKEDGHHRVRASTLRALMGWRDEALNAAALDGLASMLRDDRGEHRAAGVWVAQRTLLHHGRERAGSRWQELASRVVELSKKDEDGRVRARARAFTSRLKQQLAARDAARLARAVQAGETA